MSKTHDDERLVLEETDAGNGQVDITMRCVKSGRPLCRSNELGMFCDAEVCQCEEESKVLYNALTAEAGLDDFLT